MFLIWALALNINRPRSFGYFQKFAAASVASFRHYNILQAYKVFAFGRVQGFHPSKRDGIFTNHKTKKAAFGYLFCCYYRVYITEPISNNGNPDDVVIPDG